MRPYFWKVKTITWKPSSTAAGNLENKTGPSWPLDLRMRRVAWSHGTDTWPTMIRRGQEKSGGRFALRKETWGCIFPPDGFDSLTWVSPADVCKEIRCCFSAGVVFPVFPLSAGVWYCRNASDPHHWEQHGMEGCTFFNQKDEPGVISIINAFRSRFGQNGQKGFCLSLW